MNNPSRRILYIVIMSLAVVTLLLSVAGIIGAWVARSELHQTLDVVSRLSFTALQRSRNLVARIDPPLAKAQTAVQSATAQVREGGQTLQDTNLIIAGAERLLNQDLSVEVNTLTTTVTAASEALQSAEDTLNALARLPFVDGNTGVIGDARQLIDEMQAIEQSLRDTREALQTRKDQAIQTVVETLTTPLDRLDERLTSLGNRSQSIQTRLNNAENRVPVITSQAKTAITLVVVIITLALIWTIISQVIVFVFARERYRGLKAEPAAGTPPA
jgi:chromosome segregation ATPase